MKLWLLSQKDNRGYDTFDSCIVAAENEEEVKKIHPGCLEEYPGWHPYKDWANSPESVQVKLIGEAISEIERGVILASFNAG